MTLGTLGKVAAAAGIAVASAVATLAGTGKERASLEAKVDLLIQDMAKVKCRLNVDNICPPGR